MKKKNVYKHLKCILNTFCYEITSIGISNTFFNEYTIIDISYTVLQDRKFI